MNAIVRYKLAILYGIMFSIGTLASNIEVAFAHVSFKDLAKEDWIIIACGVIGAWTTTMLAFLSKAMQHIPPDAPAPPKQSTQ